MTEESDVTASVTGSWGPVRTADLKSTDLPSPWKRVSYEALQFMLSYDGYRHVAGGPELLTAKIIEPARLSLEVLGHLPREYSLRDLRALLFGLARMERFDDGYLESAAGLHFYHAALDALRAALVDRETVRSAPAAQPGAPTQSWGD